jgi:GalNAc-alpha-(1->4)-GalNAc-alpha-(1->3)-diNAcBac-PP-undecaprenol alpha-1,4-N-acetyl-D-galactosaminyltransferase
MKLCFIVKSLSLAGGGAERVLAEIANGLADRGHEVAVVSFDSAGSTDFYPFRHSVGRQRLGIGDTARPSRTLDTVRQVCGLRRTVLRSAPDLAIGFMHSAYIPLSVALAGTGIPVIASEHTVYAHYADKPVQRSLLRLTSSLMSKFIGISDEVRSGFPQAVRAKMAIIPNPVSAGAVARADPAGGAEKVLLTVGRLSQEKGHETLIRAFARVQGAFPEWRLRIVGEGVLRPNLEALVQDLNLSHRVFLPGATNNVTAEYLQAQVFVMPSTYESFGLATAEALAHGLPAIGFKDCPGTNALIVHRENGLLVGGTDRTSALAEGLASLMESAEERMRMGAAAPLRLADFAPAKVIDQWDILLTDAMSARESSRPPRRGTQSGNEHR